MGFMNIALLSRLYWTFIQTHVYGALFMHNIFKSWKYVVATYTLFFIVYLRQKFNKSVVYLDDGQVMLHHIINGREVKLVLKKSEFHIDSVVDEDIDNCYLDEIIPFFRYETVKFHPSFINVNKRLYIHFNDETVQIVPPESQHDD